MVSFVINARRRCCRANSAHVEQGRGQSLALALSQRSVKGVSSLLGSDYIRRLGNIARSTSPRAVGVWLWILNLQLLEPK